MELFRPVGLAELGLVYESGMRAFPPRLPGQPIFYPVLTEQYARQIARDWNSKTDPNAGFITRFEVQESFARGFEPQRVGGKEHVELWVPAARVEEFNRHLEGPITVTEAFFTEGYVGEIPTNYLLQGKSALDQLIALADILDYNGMDFILELRTNHKAIFLNFPFWALGSEPAARIAPERRAKVLAAIRYAWPTDRPSLPQVEAIAA